LHVFPDDRAEIAAALDLSGARHLLEPGCGPGFYATAFAAAYPDLRVTGIDRAPAQVVIARRRTMAQGLTNACFVVGDAQHLQVPAGSFDRIVASRLLMVVDDPVAALAEFRRMLAPGGILLLAEPVRPQSGVLAVLRREAHARGRTERYIEPPAERHFTADAFLALVKTQVWASMALWKANGYYYARCRTCTSADCGMRRTCP
jgi:ubiquinone/menaquinone biosynthesis C-methylase UbiE